jgi:hypothetical protein
VEKGLRRMRKERGVVHGEFSSVQATDFAKCNNFFNLEYTLFVKLRCRGNVGAMFLNIPGQAHASSRAALYWTGKRRRNGICVPYANNTIRTRVEQFQQGHPHRSTDMELKSSETARCRS